MTWIVKWQGEEYSSDDFTLDELGRIEKESGTAWSVLNPLRTASVAKAFLRVVLARAGEDAGRVEKLTAGQLKWAFDFRPDEEPGKAPAASDGDDAVPLDTTSPDSSPGEVADFRGSRKKRAASA